MLKKIKNIFINIPIKHPKSVLIISFIITLLSLGAIPKIKTDTDPVHMLPQNNPAVILHNKIKKDFEVADIVALGIHSEKGKTLFTPEKLAMVKKITDDILKIRDTDGSHLFIAEDLVSISTIDDIVTNQRGELLVQPLMAKAPQTQEEANTILKKLNDNPLFKEKVVSQNGELIGIFIPLAEGKKERSYFLGEKIKEITERHLGGEEYYFAGLPIAETTFGNEMFIQMAVYAPMAGLVIFLLLLLFFKSAKLVMAPMLIAMMSVIWSMAALVYTGNVIHIMSSMIPIFIMPIAVLDSIHILSALSRKIGEGLSKEQAIKETLENLFSPMLYTSLTTLVGFVSLATTGIPPVIVFGLAIAFGVSIGFFLTIFFIPAYTMLVSKKTLQKFGISENTRGLTHWMSLFFKKMSSKHSKAIIILSIGTLIISIFGVKRIIINDNPVRWFKEGHPLRTADIQMNKNLAGTYMTNLLFHFDTESENLEESGDADFDEFSTAEELDRKSIKNPVVLNYIDQVTQFLKTLKDQDGNAIIGSTTGINDLVRQVGKVALNDPNLPKTQEGIEQSIFLFESGDSKKGREIWKLMTRDGKETQVWVHFKSGDNQLMSYVMKELRKFQETNPPPIIESEPLKIHWSGLMHINNVWQETMVRGMGEALLSSFIIVFFMMWFLFRSFKWGIIAMLPLSITIVFIYGLIGFSGKFYDMPIAVLSSLTLGLSVDFAIHFIDNSIVNQKKERNFSKTFDALFAGTAQAIWRNVMVIAIGFLPLFFATLQPYVTVGTFFFFIMIVGGFVTLLLIPSILKEFQKILPVFKENNK